MNLKPILLAFAVAISGAAYSASVPLTMISGSITTENLVDAGACTTGGCVESEVRTAGAVTVQVTGTYTASGGLSAQVTTDGLTWVTLGASSTFTRASTGVQSATITSAQQDVYQVPVAGYKRFRVTALGAVTGTAVITIQPTELVPSGFATISGGAGDASAANQVTGNASLASIDGKLPAQGQALAAASVPVVLTAAQISTLTPPAVAQGSTTSGQTGGLMQGAVTTSSPSYTTAQTSPLSLDTSGSLRVNVVSGGAGGGSVDGTTAHDAAGAAVDPVAVGGYASAAAPADVSADADVVRSWHLRNGAQATQTTFAGVLASAGAGAVGTGVQRTTLASDDPAVAGLGGTADAAATAGSTGSINAKLRLMTTQLATLDTSINASNAQLPTALGQTTMSASLSTAVASNQAAVALWGHGATGAAVPANATQVGVRTGANMVAMTQGATTAAINISTATTTELVALSGSTQIRVTSLSTIAGGTGNITFVYGTGTACGTGTTPITGAYPLIANAGLTLGGGLGPVLILPAGQALCATTSAAVQMSGHVTYAQY